jgi:ABC-type Fe3+ transport system substrate-binding protein
VLFSSDQRQMIDWLAQGRYLLGLWVSSTQLKVAVDQGLPVAELPGLTFKEGAPVGAGGGTVNICADAPHPNAAKVFINWLLSRDGQINWQETVQQPSLRQDIPRGDLEPEIIPLQDKPHTDGGTEEFFTRISDDDIRAVVLRALESREGRTPAS